MHLSLWRKGRMWTQGIRGERRGSACMMSTDPCLTSKSASSLPVTTRYDMLLLPFKTCVDCFFSLLLSHLSPWCYCCCHENTYFHCLFSLLLSSLPTWCDWLLPWKHLFSLLVLVAPVLPAYLVRMAVAVKRLAFIACFCRACLACLPGQPGMILGYWIDAKRRRFLVLFLLPASFINLLSMAVLLKVMDRLLGLGFVVRVWYI